MKQTLSRMIFFGGVLIVAVVLVHRANSLPALAAATVVDVNASSMNVADTELALAHGAFHGPVLVDQTACTMAAVQCSGSGGISGELPGTTNRNPVALTFELLDAAGNPITGVTQSSVIIDTARVPAGGAGLTYAGCSSCFQENRPGVYTIFVQPIGMNNWKSGNYVVILRGAGVTPRALVQITIP